LEGEEERHKDTEAQRKKKKAERKIGTKAHRHRGRRR
jgi:hypothetical protein